MFFQRVLTGRLAISKVEWSLEGRNEDLTRRLAIFSKVGSFKKEWDAEIWPKEPGVVARVTADGYIYFLPCQVFNKASSSSTAVLK